MTITDKFANEVLKAVLEEIEKRKTDLANGWCEDFSAYRHQAGIIVGLAMIHKMVEEAHRNIYEN